MTCLQKAHILLVNASSFFSHHLHDYLILIHSDGDSSDLLTENKNPLQLVKYVFLICFFLTSEQLRSYFHVEAYIAMR